MNSSSCPVLLIGLDAADWKLVSTKIAAGELPNLAQLVVTGASGPLRSLHPLFSPALWSTIATGKHPYVHDITGFTLPDDAGTGLKSYDSTSRSSPALWNILSSSYAGKLKSNIVGWWTTAPAENIHGVMVDETFRIARKPHTEAWPVPENSVTPTTIADDLKNHRVHPQKISEALLRQLVPKLYEIDITSDSRISGIAKILAEDLTNLEITLHLMSQPGWDFTSVYLIGLDSLSHQGMLHREPSLLGKTSRDSELYGELVDRAYQLYDTWIGRLITAAGEKTNIVLVSDHGFYHDHQRPTNLGIEATAPCAHHAPTGTLIMAGPCIKRKQTITHASILDICPTVLALLDLPAGRDMPGHVLQHAFTFSSIPKRIASWDEHCPIASQKTSLQKPSSETTRAALLQLVALGYLQELPMNHLKATKEAHVSQLLHRALAYLNNEQFPQAIPLLENARSQDPERTDILAELANAYLLLNEPRFAAANFKQLVRSRYRDALRSWGELEKKINPTTKPSIAENWALRRLLARAHVDDDGLYFTTILANWIVRHRESDLDQMIELAKKNPNDPFMAFHTGQACLSSRREKQGLLFLHQSATWKTEEAEALAIIADYENKIGNFTRAEAHAREALHRNPLHPASWLALGTSLAAQQRWQEAREAATQATTSALRKSKACELLADITLKETGNKVLAARYQKIATRAAKLLKSSLHSHQSKISLVPTQKHAASFQKIISPLSSLQPFNSSTFQQTVVVTGLPRSGTSLLMQMLTAGGMKIFTDHHRDSDEHNPRGYFEHEKIKQIADDDSFLQEAAGKALKIVIPLLWELPNNFQGNILFIRRNLEEVIASQKKMADLQTSSEELLKAYRYYEAKTIEIIQNRGWHVLEVSHSSLLSEPKKSAHAIAGFLGNHLNASAMADVVIPSLHRIKSSDTNKQTAFQEKKSCSL